MLAIEPILISRSLFLRDVIQLLFSNPGIIYLYLQRNHDEPNISRGKRMDHHDLSVEEILQFPDDYHTKGVLSLPYGDIVEPFEAWYSKQKKMSRIDYYNGR